MTNPRYIVYKQHQIPLSHFKIAPDFRTFKRMNKIDLIQALKDSNHLSKSEAEAVVNLFFDKMADALAQGDRVEIRGLCSFFVKK
jgi:hypothetical protein